MFGFESYHKVINLLDNPDYDFISYNIDPEIVIYKDGYKRKIKDEFASLCFLTGEEQFKRDRNLISLHISQSFVVLSVFAIIYTLIGLILFFFSSELVFDNRFLWFLIFGITFLFPLLVGVYKLVTQLIRLNKRYKALKYETFCLSQRMMLNNKRATFAEISTAVDDLTNYFERNYHYFDYGKQIKSFF